MSQPIVYIDTSEVRPGRLEELKAAMNDLARFVQANEPQLIAYNVYFNDDGTRMSVLHINPDSASLGRHMKVAGPKFPPIGEFISLLSIDIYGQPDDGLVEELRQKAKMLGSGTVRLHDLHAGFARLPKTQIQWWHGKQRRHDRYLLESAGDRGMPGDGMRLDERLDVPIRRPMLKTPPAGISIPQRTPPNE